MNHYRYFGQSGLKTSRLTLGLYRNFEAHVSDAFKTRMLEMAVNHGVTHFDLANNYGEPNGSAELAVGRALKQVLRGKRDQLLIATKAGYPMGPGPYGKGGSKKHLTASLDQSLKRLGTDYVDVYYHHTPDAETAVEETAHALDALVQQGKTLYIGLSNYNASEVQTIMPYFKALKTPVVAHQLNYSLLLRDAETNLFDQIAKEGLGAVVYQPLYQGILTEKYLHGIPAASRMSQRVDSLKHDQLTAERLALVEKLRVMGVARSQSVAQLALAFVLRLDVVATAVIGVSSEAQLLENIATLNNLTFSVEELCDLEAIFKP